MAFDATLGGEMSNSYITVEEADTILSERIGVGDVWTELSEGEKEVALISSTRRLEQEEYESRRDTDSQSLQFPRRTFWANGVEYVNTAMPVPVKYACAELALQLVRDPTLLDDTGLEPFSSLTRGDTSLTMRGIAAGKLPAQVSRFLRGIRVGSDNVIRVQRA